MPPAPTNAVMAAWWAWVLGQAAVVALYAGGVAPAGGYPAPVDGTADLGLAVAQCVLASTLGPTLLGSTERVMRALAAALPMTVLAACLAGTDAATATRTTIITAAWVVALGWPSGRVARVIASGLTLGGPLLWYVASEFGGHAVALGDGPTLLCPVLGVCSTRLHGDAGGPLAAAALTLVTLLLASRAENRLRSQSLLLS